MSIHDGPRLPLSEIGNQRQPRPKKAQTYGKKNGLVPQSRQVQLAIFGQDQVNVTDKLASLTLTSQSATPAAIDDSDLPSVTEKQSTKGKTQQRPQLIAQDVSTQTTTRRTKPKQSSVREIPRNTVLSDDNDLIAIAPLLALSGKEIETFETLSTKLSRAFDIEKIGEGSYAEVFKLRSQRDDADESVVPSDGRLMTKSMATNTLNESSLRNTAAIIKIIPLHHPTSKLKPRAEERRSSIDSVAREIDLLRHLDSIHGFIRFRGVRLVSGPWPEAFLAAFRTFQKQHRKRAINSPPDEDFEDNQIYALVEMDDAGYEISLLERPSVFQAWDIFWNTVILLANAEETIQFEHRDLHMSNICVKQAPLSSTNTKDTLTAPSETPRLRTSSRTVGTRGNMVDLTGATMSQPELPDIDVQTLRTMTEQPTTRLGLSNLRVTIIDYTIARAQLSDLSSPTRQQHERLKQKPKAQHVVLGERTIFSPLTFTSDPFRADGDIETHLQMLTYKKTKAVALSAQADMNTQSPGSPPPVATNLANAVDQDGGLDLAPIEDPENNEASDLKWRSHLPRTNTIWLGYLLRILIHRSRPRTTQSKKSAPTSEPRFHILKGSTGKSGNNKFVASLQQEMWQILQEVSACLNGSDHASGGDEITSKQWNLSEDVRHDDDDDTEHNQEQPSWTRAQLEQLPHSATDVLCTSLTQGWLTAEEILHFRQTLELEGESG